MHVTTKLSHRQLYVLEQALMRYRDELWLEAESFTDPLTLEIIDQRRGVTTDTLNQVQALMTFGGREAA